jgi:hypothetical protein
VDTTFNHGPKKLSSSPASHTTYQLLGEIQFSSLRFGCLPQQLRKGAKLNLELHDFIITHLFLSELVFIKMNTHSESNTSSSRASHHFVLGLKEK